MKTKYLLLTTLVFLALAVPVFASSSTFLSQAQKYINANCSRKKIQDQTALFCYLFNKSQEQDAGIAAINTTLSPTNCIMRDLTLTEGCITSKVTQSTVPFQSGGSRSEVMHELSKQAGAVAANGSSLSGGNRSPKSYHTQ